MRIAIVTFEGFNEIDSFVALNILNRVKYEGWKAEIVAPTDCITSMNGVVIHSQQPLSFVNRADAVLFGSGRLTRAAAQDDSLMAQFDLDPTRQLIGSQCSGALVMKRLGLVEDTPVCTDSTTKPWLIEAGAQVVDRAFNVKGNVATAGGCLSSQYLASWVVQRKLGSKVVAEVLRSVAPVGEEDFLVDQTLSLIETGGFDLRSCGQKSLTDKINAACSSDEQDGEDSLRKEAMRATQRRLLEGEW